METEKLLPLLVQKGAVFLVRFLGVLLAFAIAWLVARWAARATERALDKPHLDPTLTRFAANFLRYAIIVAAFVACLGAVGFQTATFAAVIGAAGIAIGLAFQNTLSNFAAGVMLLFLRPFKVGDTIRVTNQLGVVNALELFATRLTTPDNRKISVPNASIVNQVLENLSFYPTRRVEVLVPMPIDTDIERAQKAFETGLRRVAGVLEDPAPEAYVNDVAGAGPNPGVHWQLRAWCKTEDYTRVHQATMRIAKQVIDQMRSGKPTH